MCNINVIKCKIDYITSDRIVFIWEWYYVHSTKYAQKSRYVVLGNHIVDKGFGYDQIYLFYLFKLDSTSKRKREIHEQISQTH